jgi:hypothetical protein
MNKFVVDTLSDLRVPVRGTSLETFEVSKAAVAASGRTAATKKAGGATNLMLPTYDARAGFNGGCVVLPTGASPATRRLQFTSWELFHAAKKSELTQYTARAAQRAAIGMSLEYTPIFWWKGNLSLLPGAVSSRKDAGRTNLAGRVGEGLGHLLMEKRFGFKYWDHLPSLFLRLAVANAASHPAMLRQAHATMKSVAGKAPDFVFEKKNEVALAECKGHFVEATKKGVPFGGELRAAMAQLRQWPSRIFPTPSRSFATNAVIVERGHAIPSFLCFADPEGDGGEEPLPLGDDLRRGNYAAWLLAMGLDDEAEALRWKDDWAPSGKRLLVARIGGRQFALTPPGSIGRAWYWSDHDMWLWRRGRLGEVVAGIDLTVLKAIKTALRGDELVDVDLPTELVHDERFSGSVLADGTLLGSVRLAYPEEAFEPFEL